MSEDGKCCGCDYDGEEETECTERDDGQHCVHWYDGPSPCAPDPPREPTPDRTDGGNG
jgi:hypothetical protein